jgi:hypothetical protein
MRKVAIVAVSLIAVAGAALYALTLPAVMEPLFDLTCREMTPRCQVRARAIGHAWSGKGDPERAIGWYRKAADAGDPTSMFHLAWMLEEQAIAGMPAAHDKWVEASGSSDVPEMKAVDALFAKAADWYRRAADKGFAPAMNNLGEMYKDGMNGARNPQMAAHYFRMAAQAGNPVGAFNLSLAYRMGDGVTRDVAQADKWAEWSPGTKFSEADFAAPILERTRFLGGDIPTKLTARLRAVADNGPPAVVKLELSPLKPDPSLPTFQQVREEVSRQKR